MNQSTSLEKNKQPAYLKPMETYDMEPSEFTLGTICMPKMAYPIAKFLPVTELVHPHTIQPIHNGQLYEISMIVPHGEFEYIEESFKKIGLPFMRVGMREFHQHDLNVFIPPFKKESKIDFTIQVNGKKEPIISLAELIQKENDTNIQTVKKFLQYTVDSINTDLSTWNKRIDWKQMYLANNLTGEQINDIQYSLPEVEEENHPEDYSAETSIFVPAKVSSTVQSLIESEIDFIPESLSETKSLPNTENLFSCLDINNQDVIELKFTTISEPKPFEFLNNSIAYPFTSFEHAMKKMGIPFLRQTNKDFTDYDTAVFNPEFGQVLQHTSNSEFKPVITIEKALKTISEKTFNQWTKIEQAFLIDLEKINQDLNLEDHTFDNEKANLQEKAYQEALQTYPGRDTHLHNALSNAVHVMCSNIGKPNREGPSMRELAAIAYAKKHGFTEGEAPYEKMVKLFLLADGPIFGQLTDLHFLVSDEVQTIGNVKEDVLALLKWKTKQPIKTQNKVN